VPHIVSTGYDDAVQKDRRRMTRITRRKQGTTRRMRMEWQRMVQVSESEEWSVTGDESKVMVRDAPWILVKTTRQRAKVKQRPVLQVVIEWWTRRFEESMDESEEVVVECESESESEEDGDDDGDERIVKLEEI